MQEKVYKKLIKDIDELCARILTAWEKMDQRIIDIVRQWRTCLCACIKAKGGHFKHYIASVMCFANGIVLTTRHMC